MLNFYYNDTLKAIDYSHTISREHVSPDFHMHNRYEIYFFISGDLNYFIEKKVYPLKYGDLFIINSNEIHKPYFKSKGDYERIVIHFDPELANIMSSPGFNLLQCFTGRPKGEQNKISLNKNQIEDILKLFNKIDSSIKLKYSGSEIMKLMYFVELLIYINRVFASNMHVEEYSHIPDRLIPILDYIDDNLKEDLSLEMLEGRFFINRFYLSRLFKKNTGISIHEYILFKRISKAKELLMTNQNVTEVHQLVGFNDYSNFIRTFKRIVGVSPGKYKKNNDKRS